MKREDIVERLEKLEEKNQEIEKENQRLKEIIEKEVETSNSATDSNQNISRRDFLKKIGVGAAGVGALGLAPAASQLKLTKNGIFGSTGQSQEIENVETLNVKVSNMQQIGSERHYAGAYPGSNPDQRLDNAIADASAGDVIYLENALYDALRTSGNGTAISKRLTLLGTGVLSAPSGQGVGTTIGNDWEITARGRLSEAVFNESGSLIINGRAIRIHRLEGRGADAPITVKDDEVIITESRTLDVTFQNGTTNGIVDNCVLTTVTDNGTNTIGNTTS